jgi:GH25 family lysozyme M1 (1,4-beta-N-acetylmuramidase)
MPKGWNTWAYWQFTDAEAISGISGKCDCSVSHGTEEDLFRMAGLTVEFTNITMA